MTYNITPQGKGIVLTLTGTVDLSETAEIKDAIKDEPKFGYSVIEVEGVDLDYIDSSAVALLLFIKRLAEQEGMAFEITQLSSAAAKVIQLAGLANVLNVPQTQQATIEPQRAQDPASEKGHDDNSLDTSLEAWFNEPTLNITKGDQ